jgi:NAD(P)-dependent dehydrogenase (short-subunit alcohol dehydrogenase family)
MANEVAQIVAVDISAPALTMLPKDLETAGANVTTMQVGVLNAQQVERMVDLILKMFGRIDILVNVVGGSNVLVDAKGTKSAIMSNNQAKVDDITLGEWNKSIQFNLTGTYLCAKAVVPHMKKQGSGKITNFSSVSGHAKDDTNSAYVAAKAGIMAFTKKIANEVSPYGVNCNAIAPGVTATGRSTWWENLSNEEKQGVTDRIPLKRLGQPDDQAKIVAFLASQDSDYGQSTWAAADRQLVRRLGCKLKPSGVNVAGTHS